VNQDLVMLREYVQSRSAEVFADIVRRHAGLVYGTCLRILKNRQDAEDVSQECFWELAQKANSVRSSLAGWLHAAATNRAKDAIRTEVRRREREQQAVEPSAPGEPDWEEVAAQVDAILESMPADLREPLIRHVLQGHTQTQVAEALGIDQSTVSRRLETGVRVLRDRLKRAGVVASAAFLVSMLTTHASAAVPATLTAALGKMALAGLGQTAAAAAPAALSGTAMGKLAVVAVAGAVVAGSLAVHQHLRKPAPPPNAPAAVPAAPAPWWVSRVMVRGLVKAIHPAGTKLDPAFANATLTVTSNGQTTVYYVSGWAGVTLARQADGRRAEVSGAAYKDNGRLVIAGGSADVKLVAAE